MSPLSLRLFAALLALWPLAASALKPGEPLRFEEGIARNPRTAAELYREQHWVRNGPTRILERVVLYRCPDGTAFARKRVDYARSTLAPSFSFEDQRSGLREGLRGSAQPQLFFRGAGETRERTAPVAAESLVADAGFDEFVRTNWLALTAGKRLPLRFAVPSRLSSYGFAVARAGSASIAGEPAWVFRLKLEGLLGWVAPAIDVSYGKESRRLLRFAGLSNLRDDAGNAPLVARIDFPKPAVAASAEQWRQALEAPLSACRAGR